ncbi:MAG: hypothetical protein IH946_10630 [Bacteroidetes bacterium]|nr:hypothetical protein [Bacteroidota bacterium]
MAVKSPAVSLTRSILGLTQADPQNVLERIYEIGLNGIRLYFDSETAQTIIKRKSRQKSYWKKVLDYAYKNEWQAVIDEYIYLLASDHHILHPETTNDKIEPRNFETMLDELELAINLHPGTVTFRVNHEKKLRTRSHYALAYDDESSTPEHDRRGAIRAAFNSPFFPFVVATTSIGQEGIDFHRYCHDIMHWNLPSNPVDLEQREGRIDRYNSMVVRKNVGMHLRNKLLSINNSELTWIKLFKLADIEAKHPLAPRWIFKNELDDSHKIRRHVILLPFSRDRATYKALSNTLAFYRIAFGQPRQSDLLDALEKSKLNEKEIQKLFLDLRPKSS